MREEKDRVPTGPGFGHKVLRLLHNVSHFSRSGGCKASSSLQVSLVLGLWRALKGTGAACPFCSSSSDREVEEAREGQSAEMTPHIQCSGLQSNWGDGKAQLLPHFKGTLRSGYLHKVF